jgi:membrane fusion protein
VFLFTARYARKETVFGQITPIEGSFRITPQYTGLAEKVLVHEGQHVKAGDELLVVSSDPLLQNGASLAAGLKLIQATQRRTQSQQESTRVEQVQRQIEELRTRQSGIKSDLQRLRDARVLLEKREALQEKNLKAHRALAEQGMVSEAYIRQQEDTLLGIQQQVQQSQREYESQSSRLAEIAPQIGRLIADAALARLNSTSSQADMQEKELNSEAQLGRHLQAPIDGVITALQARPGAPVTANQTLAVIVPETAIVGDNAQLEVELWAPSRAVGFVRPGARVRIMYDAFPYQTFGVGEGRVRDVSGTPVLPTDLPIPLDTREQLFRIRVVLNSTSLMAYGKAWPVFPGMRLSADLILEEESLIDWLLEPLRAARKRAI